MGQTSSAGPLAAVKFDREKAWAHLIKQVDFGPRVPMQKGHKECGDYLLEELRKVCDTVREQPFEHKWSVTGKPVQMRNLIGELNWAKGSPKVLLMAHWDTRPYATEETDPVKAKKPIAGANDGASGVAVLLELMRVLKEQKPGAGIMVLLTDGEDLGPTLGEMFLGAKHFAANLPKPKPEYGILLDMVGDKDLQIPVEPNSYNASPPLVKAFYLHARAVGLQATFPSEFQGAIIDDHLPLIDAGVPTMDLIDFEYAPWHTLGDTPDKCSPESLFKVGAMLETWLMKPKPWRPA